MAERKSRGGSGDSTVQVLVEMAVAKDQSPAATMSQASDVGVSSFVVDESYEPVPAGESGDSAQNSALENAGQESVYVLGTISEKDIKELEKQPNVLGVGLNTPIAPFSDGPGGEFEPFVPPAQAPGTCPIPPCDCDHGTAACSKGSMAQVAQYLGVDHIWANGHKGQGIVVACVDGGITAQGRPISGSDTGHPSWPNKLIPRVIGGWPTTSWGTTGVSWGWHGNMVATDVLGMAPEAQIYDIRIASGSMAGTMAAALAGYQWAINQYKANGTPQIMSNSWGIYQKSWDPNYADNPNHPFTRKMVEAVNEGIIVLFAAGNCGDGCPSSRCGNDTGPSKSIWGANGHPVTITVGAANIRNQLVGYSSQGPSSMDNHKPDFCSISHFTGFFNCDTGTSAACPIAAGVVALLKQCNGNLTQASAKAVLKATAKNIGPGGWDQHSGSGIIQAKAAYDRICTDPCQRHRTAYEAYRKRYNETKNKNYLCLAYRSLAAWYCCRYQQTEQPLYLCYCYRYYAAYYQCLYQQSQNKAHLCLYYRYIAAFYCCLSKHQKNPQYLCICHRYYANYYRCMYEQTKDRKYLCRYYYYLAAYYCCLHKNDKKPEHRCLCLRYYAAYYSCLYQVDQDKANLCRYYYYLGAYYCCLFAKDEKPIHRCYCYRYYAAYYHCLYQNSRNPQHLCLHYYYTAAFYCCMYAIDQKPDNRCNCYRYYAYYYRCRYGQTQNRRDLCLSYRYYAAYYCCRYRITGSEADKRLCDRYTTAARNCQ